MPKPRYTPIIYISVDKNYGYNVVAYDQNDDEIIARQVIDITEWINSRFDNMVIWYNFDNPDGTTHAIKGTWHIDQMTNIIADEIVPAVSD